MTLLYIGYIFHICTINSSTSVPRRIEYYHLNHSRIVLLWWVKGNGWKVMLACRYSGSSGRFTSKSAALRERLPVTPRIICYIPSHTFSFSTLIFQTFHHPGTRHKLEETRWYISLTFFSPVIMHPRRTSEFTFSNQRLQPSVNAFKWHDFVLIRSSPLFDISNIFPRQTSQRGRNDTYQRLKTEWHFKACLQCCASRFISVNTTKLSSSENMTLHEHARTVIGHLVMKKNIFLFCLQISPFMFCMWHVHYSHQNLKAQISLDKRTLKEHDIIK